MAGLPRGFMRGLVVGGIFALLWGVLADRRRRSALGSCAIEKVEAVPILGARISTTLRDQLMEGIYRAVAEDVVSQATTGELLDLGGGPGRLAVEIARRARDLQITRMDPTPDLVQLAEARTHNAGVGRQAKVVHGDIQDIPFPEGSFDFVVAIRAFQSSEAPETALAEIYRVLRPGGKAWIYDFRKETPREAWDLVRQRLPLLTQPLFDLGIMAAWGSACNEAQIDLYVSGSPFRQATREALPAEIAGAKIRALTKAALQK